ncbi:hypothetical protein TCAL_16629 [Tigriopus californicus]|uniref:Uncharacterized protein n=1 Tax=Tigriopus californicus TaxID=6832 RepID=A0A553ND26_TIGCA|nr:hypothetical protein TCAL_16629 [Tigriopus californicus]
MTLTKLDTDEMNHWRGEGIHFLGISGIQVQLEKRANQRTKERTHESDQEKQVLAWLGYTVVLMIPSNRQKVTPTCSGTIQQKEEPFISLF